jgi:hypothetical protein|tara:strand:+ start:360 stop:551 length:192 start_codon:yes stop_codon:yes gene_type:complete
MIQLSTEFLTLTIQEPDNDNDRKILARNLVSANRILFASLQLIAEEDGGFDLVHLQTESDQSH